MVVYHSTIPLVRGSLAAARPLRDGGSDTAACRCTLVVNIDQEHHLPNDTGDTLRGKRNGVGRRGCNELGAPSRHTSPDTNGEPPRPSSTGALTARYQSHLVWPAYAFWSTGGGSILQNPFEVGRRTRERWSVRRAFSPVRPAGVFLSAGSTTSGSVAHRHNARVQVPVRWYPGEIMVPTSNDP